MVEKKQTKFQQALGRRKESTATIRLFEGKGDIQVNGKSITDYFPSEASRFAYTEPFRVIGMEGKFYATISVSGGGKNGQLGAIVLAISRALVDFEEKFRKPLRDAGLLTRDPREKERKKYFLRKARKRPQYSKR
jgi:small subunit ribosomal protein S9